MKRFDVRLRLGGTFCLLVAVLFVVGWQGVRHLRQLDRETQNAIYDRWSEEQQVREAFGLSDLNSRVMLSILLLDDPDEIKRLLVQRAANTGRISELVHAIEARLNTEEEKRLLSAVEAARKPYVESYKQALAKLLDEHQRGEAQKMMVRVALPRIAVYHAAWNAFAQCQIDKIEQGIKQSKADFAAARRRLLFMIMLALLITSATAVYVTCRVTQEIADRQCAEKDLQESHNQLEQRVRQRTAELAQSNQALQAEITERKLTEEQLRVQATALDAAASAIVITDHNGTIQSVNPAFTALTGYTAKEAVGQNPRILKGGNHDEAFYRNLWQTISSGQVWIGELTNRRKDGSLYLEEMTITPLRNADGVIARYLAIKQDITARRRAESLVRQSEERYRSLFDNAKDAIFTIAADGTFTSLNPAVEAMAGISRADWIGKPFAPMVHPDDLPLAGEMFNRTLKGEKTPIHELRGNPSLSRPALMEMTLAVQKDESGKIIGVLGIGRDITERKQAEEELRLKTAFLEAQVNSSLDGILVVDQNRNVSLQNRRFIDLFKMPLRLADTGADEIRLRWVTDRIKNSEPFVQKVLYLYAHPNEISRDEIELNDGTILDRYSSPAIGKDGKYYGRIWTYRDITERKRTEEELRLKTAFLEAQVNSSIDGILVVDEQDRKILQNQRTVDLLKIPRHIADDKDDEKQRRWVMSIAKHPAQFIERVIYLNSHPNEISRDELELKDGTILDRYSSPATGKDGKYYGRVWIFRDITERKRDEEALRKIKLRLAHAMSLAQLFAWEYDVASGLFTFSDAYYALHGTTAALENGCLMSAGVFARKFLHPDDAHLVAEEIGKAMATTDLDYHSQREARIFRRDGKLRHVLVHIAITKDAAGRTIQIQGANQDITERKQLEGKLFQSQKMETVGKLAGGIAHEFNSILTAIIGQSELLLCDLPTESPLATSATEISKAANRAAALTRQLLAYGRKQILQPEPLDLNKVIASTEGMIHHLVGGAVDVYVVPAPGLHAVKADAGQIEQVVMNVAINAADAMPHGGKLTLETGNVTLDQEYVSRFSDLKAGGYVMLAVTDTGVGMSEEVKARVFEPFFTTKGVGQGTGLGLSTCYGILKQSGGHMDVYSEPGRGTTFKIYLPQVEQQAIIPAPRLAAPDLPRGTETVLLVEDDPALREMAAMLLRRLGYTVLAAANGIEALTLIHQRDTGHIDLLFTDVIMPHMSGKELADRVQASYPHTRILFTSAYTGNAIVHQGVLDKGVALLQKPFTPSALAHKLREVLDQPIAPPPDPAQKSFLFANTSYGENTP